MQPPLSTPPNKPVNAMLAFDLKQNFRILSK
jgi:hypothetical protein